MIVEADDPVAAARADRNGVCWTKNTKIVPGKTYYVKRGTNVRPFEFKFDGADFDIFTTAMLTPATAAFGPGIPFQLALNQLTKSNMASARAALMQAWRSFRREQVDHEHELRIVVKNYIAEDLARGRITLPTGDDLDAACVGFFVPPQRLSADEYREMQGAQLKKEVLGVSESTLAREYGGYDRDDERAQTAEDNALDERAGLNRNEATIIPDPEDEPEDDDEDDVTKVAGASSSSGDQA
jgi:capsid protein